MKEVNIGIIGCGNISEKYLEAENKYDILKIVACADSIPEKAEEKAEEFGIPRSGSTNKIIEDHQVDIILNLTPPRAHFEIYNKALEADKNVYGEKPLALNVRKGKKLLNKADSKNLLIGSAPDTFLGGSLQTCREIIDDGWIGKPVGATAFMTCHGHENWHPNPEQYYKPGGGPMFDMGPYYLTGLVHLLGPIEKVAGSSKITFPQRTITSQPKYGEKISVEIPTHVAGVIDFENGAIVNIITSFDVWGSKLPFIEIYGTDGSLSAPDPNKFGGSIEILTKKDKEWKEVPTIHGYTEESRGIGLADMAYALRNNRKPRASGEMAYHVLEAMQGFKESSESGHYYKLTSSCHRPLPLPPNFSFGGDGLD